MLHINNYITLGFKLIGSVENCLDNDPELLLAKTYKSGVTKVVSFDQITGHLNQIWSR